QSLEVPGDDRVDPRQHVERPGTGLPSTFRIVASSVVAGESLLDLGGTPHQRLPALVEMRRPGVQVRTQGRDVDGPGLDLGVGLTTSTILLGETRFLTLEFGKRGLERVELGDLLDQRR